MFLSAVTQLSYGQGAMQQCMREARRDGMGSVACCSRKQGNSMPLTWAKTTARKTIAESVLDEDSQECSSQP